MSVRHVNEENISQPDVNPIKQDVVDAPTIGTASAGYEQASVAFTPAPTGGLGGIYTAVSTPGSITGTSATSPITVDNLDSSTSYTFKVYGNQWSNNLSAASNSMTPNPVNTYVTITMPRYVSYGIYEYPGNKNTTSTNTWLFASDSRESGSVPRTKITALGLSGRFTWSVLLGDSTSSVQFYTTGFYVDGSDNIYAIANGDSGLTSYLFKYNSSGTFQWAKAFTNTTSPNSIGLYGVTGDSSGNVYVCGGMYTSSNTSSGILIKLDSSGNVTWQRKNGQATTNYTMTYKGVAVDSSGNVYVSGEANPAAGGRWWITKYNSSGTVQWSYWHTISGGGQSSSSVIALDSSGIPYIGIVNMNANLLLLTKITTAGAITWSRSLSGVTGTYPTPYMLTVDSSNNIWIGSFQGTSSYIPWFGKYDSTGAIQLQRTINDSWDSMVGSLSNNGTYLSINTGYASLRVPSDGSKTGTYTVPITGSNITSLNVTYAAGTLTDGAYSSYSPVTSTNTDSAGTATVNSYTPTLYTSTTTYNRTVIP